MFVPLLWMLQQHNCVKQKVKVAINPNFLMMQRSEYLKSGNTYVGGDTTLLLRHLHILICCFLVTIKSTETNAGLLSSPSREIFRLLFSWLAIWMRARLTTYEFGESPILCFFCFSSSSVLVTIMLSDHRTL